MMKLAREDKRLLENQDKFWWKQHFIEDYNKWQEYNQAYGDDDNPDLEQLQEEDDEDQEEKKNLEKFATNFFRD